jgi:hypothetical protein
MCALLLSVGFLPSSLISLGPLDTPFGQVLFVLDRYIYVTPQPSTTIKPPGYRRHGLKALPLYGTCTGKRLETPNCIKPALLIRAIGSRNI